MKTIANSYYYSITQDKYFHFGYYTPFIFWEFIISGPKVYYLLRYKCIINIIFKLHVTISINSFLLYLFSVY